MHEDDAETNEKEQEKEGGKGSEKEDRKSGTASHRNSAHSSLSHIHTSISHIQHHHYIVHTHPDTDKNINHHLEDDVPTPLPPNFLAIPQASPQSAKWIAVVSALVMVVLIVFVVVLAFVF